MLEFIKIKILGGNTTQNLYHVDSTVGGNETKNAENAETREMENEETSEVKNTETNEMKNEETSKMENSETNEMKNEETSKMEIIENYANTDNTYQKIVKYFQLCSIKPASERLEPLINQLTVMPTDVIFTNNEIKLYMRRDKLGWRLAENVIGAKKNNSKIIVI